MSNRTHQRKPKPVPIGRQEMGLSALGAQRFDLRDPYHLAVSLSWPAFTVAMLACWLAINLVFASLYWLRPGDVANTVPGSFSDVIFFSIETLATVGYGVMAPATLYGHIVSAVEIVTGMAFTAIVTGLLFVRFSRPKAKIVWADGVVVTTHNGRPTLMLRVVNGRVTTMSSATARLFVLLAEQTAEGTTIRRVHELRLSRTCATTASTVSGSACISPTWSPCARAAVRPRICLGSAWWNRMQSLRQGGDCLTASNSSQWNIGSRVLDLHQGHVRDGLLFSRPTGAVAGFCVRPAGSVPSNTSETRHFRSPPRRTCRLTGKRIHRSTQ